MLGEFAALGPVCQIAYVAADLDAAVHFWVRSVGAGPFWLLEHPPNDVARYRGQEIEMDMSLAVGYWGGLQIEIVHQHNDGPSIYRAQQDTGDRAINHLGIFLDDLDPARAVVERSGSEIIQEMYVDGAGAMYVDVERTGTIVEYVLLPPYVADAFAALKAAADGWDGREVYVDLQ